MNSYADRARASSTLAPAVLFCFSAPAICSAAVEPWNVNRQRSYELAVALSHSHILIKLGSTGAAYDIGGYDVPNNSLYRVVQTAIAEHPKIGAELASLVGDNGCARLRRFAELDPGWDNGHGAPLAASSLETLNYFLEQTGHRPSGVSVFMTQAGNAVINWPVVGGLVELEFSEGAVEYFIESTGEEDVIPTTREAIKKLERKLRAS